MILFGCAVYILYDICTCNLSVGYNLLGETDVFIFFGSRRFSRQQIFHYRIFRNKFSDTKFSEANLPINQFSDTTFSDNKFYRKTYIPTIKIILVSSKQTVIKVPYIAIDKTNNWCSFSPPISIYARCLWWKVSGHFILKY